MLLLSSTTSSSFDDNSIILDPESNSVDVKISPLINGDHYSLTTSDILSLESIRSTLVRQGRRWIIYDDDDDDDDDDKS